MRRYQLMFGGPGQRRAEPGHALLVTEGCNREAALELADSLSRLRCGERKVE